MPEKEKIWEMSDEEWNDLTKDQQGDWITYWESLEENDEIR